MIYDRLALYYDQFIDKDLYNIYLKFIRKFHKKGNVIDLGCGTAPLAIALAKKGFYVTATDISEAMLENAYNNSVVVDVKVNFYLHDILEPLNAQYDVITMSSDVINYLDEKSKILTAFKNVTSAMSKNSIFIFDFLNTDYLDSIIGHYEEIILEDSIIKWRVEKTNVNFQVKHILDINSSIETHIQTTFMKTDYIKWLKESDLKVIKTKSTKERTILVCKKETS